MFSMTLLSMIFSYVGLAGCQFMKVRVDEVDEDFGFGFFNQVAYDSDGDKFGCLPYDEDTKDDFFSDSPWKAGRAFGTLTVMTLTFAFFTLALVMLFLDMYKGILWIALRVMYTIAFLTNLFTFSVFAADICSDTDCTVGPSGGLAIFNIWILIFLIIISWLTLPPPNPVFRLSEGPSPENIAEVREVKEDDHGREQGVETIANQERFIEYGKQKQPAMLGEEKEDDGECKESPYDEEGGGKGGEKPNDEERHESNTSTDSPNENVKITTEITPEGKKIVEVVTHPDGAKTVTTTIEALEDDDEEEGTDDEEDVDDDLKNEGVEIVT